MEQLNPQECAPPAASYALGTLVSNPTALICTSGIVGTTLDGTTPDTIAEQAHVIWASIDAVLREGGLTLSDIASVTTYVVDSPTLPDDLGVVMAARDAALGSHRAASTLLVVPRLARPQWLMEIAVVAAR